MAIIKATYVNFKFDIAAWARDIEAARVWQGSAVLAGLIGCSETTLSNWARGNHKMGFEYPSMTLFMRACNLLDLDPRNYFILDE